MGMGEHSVVVSGAFLTSLGSILVHSQFSAVYCGCTDSVRLVLPDYPPSFLKLPTQAHKIQKKLQPDHPHRLMSTTEYEDNLCLRWETFPGEEGVFD